MKRDCRQKQRSSIWKWQSTHRIILTSYKRTILYPHHCFSLAFTRYDSKISFWKIRVWILNDRKQRITSTNRCHRFVLCCASASLFDKGKMWSYCFVFEISFTWLSANIVNTTLDYTVHITHNNVQSILSSQRKILSPGRFRSPERVYSPGVVRSPSRVGSPRRVRSL